MDAFTCTDKDGITVVCKKDTWDNHIVPEHPEMKGCEAIVKAAIEQPYQIYQDGRHVNRRNVYKPFVLPRPFHTQYLRVTIEYRKMKITRKLRGYVITAFPSPAKRKGDIMLWEERL